MSFLNYASKTFLANLDVREAEAAIVINGMNIP